MADKKQATSKSVAKGKSPGARPTAKESAAKKPAKKPAAAAPAKPAKAGKPATPVAKAAVASKPVKSPAKPAAKPAAPAKPAKVAPVAAKPAAPAKPAKAAPAAANDQPAAAAGGGNGAKVSGFVAKQKQRLLDLRDELINSMYGVTRDTLRNAPEGSEASGSGMHQGDAGSDAYDRDFALSVLAKEQDALYEIEEALKRIQRGTYGVCEISGKRIPQARLEAMPFARLTVECQAEWEKENGQRRFRPSADIGFGGGQLLEEDDESVVSLDDEDE